MGSVCTQSTTVERLVSLRTPHTYKLSLILNAGCPEKKKNKHLPITKSVLRVTTIFLSIAQFIPNLWKIHESNLYFHPPTHPPLSGQCLDKSCNNKGECWKAMQKQDLAKKLFAFSDRQNVNESVSIPISIMLLTQLFRYMDFTVSLTRIFTFLMLYLNRFSLLKNT